MNTLQEYMNQIVKDVKILNKEKCIDNTVMLSASLIGSFGLEMTINPDANPEKINYKIGYEKTKEFLNKICKLFDDPKHIIGIAPFANAYLGNAMFNSVLSTVIARAKDHKDEQPVLDEVFTAAALLSPELRKKFLQKIQSQYSLADGALGLENVLLDTDPKLTFSSTAEFPKQIRTDDVQKASHIIGTFMEIGTFIPGKGFTKEYDRLVNGMKSLDFLFQNPEDNSILVIGNDTNKKIKSYINGNVEFTTRHNTRPNNNGTYPSIILVNEDIPINDIKKIYGKSTIIYIANTAAENNKLKHNKELLADISMKDEAKVKAVIKGHVQFIKDNRQKYGITGLDELLRLELRYAEKLIKESNEYFYTIRESFDAMNRGNMIDAMIRKHKYKLPAGTDYDTIMLLGDDGLQKYFDHKGKNIKLQTTLKEQKNDKDKRVPLMIVTNQEFSQSQIYKHYPGATIIYIADHKKAADKIRKENDGAFIINVEETQALMLTNGMAYDGPQEIGRQLKKAFLENIITHRKKGITDIYQIAKSISENVKTIRDKILFSGYLDNFLEVAEQYYNKQSALIVAPQVMHLNDTILMKTCPTGGCFKMNEPKKGGCCGGGNLPGVLIEFAAAYRKNVGDKDFLKELQSYNNGKIVEPWYTDSMDYKKKFVPIKDINTKADKNKVVDDIFTF